jgi:V8-like Glu-specific endopeptidase
MRLTALLAVLGTTYATIDCNAGCSTAYDPVCGADGTTFVNECLAFCQNIAVASAGACGSKSTRGLAGEKQQESVKPASVREDGVVTVADMNRFADEGFVCKGMHHLIASTPRHLKSKEPSNAELLAAERPFGRKGLVGVRITKEGLLYESSSKSPPGSGSSAPIPNTGGRRLRGARDLDILGKDERREVTGTSAFPNSAIGQIDVEVVGTSSEIVCSGALVSKDYPDSTPLRARPRDRQLLRPAAVQPWPLRRH